MPQAASKCAVALGVGANIKYQTLIAIPYLLIRRQWRAAASALVSTAAFAFLPALVVGLPRNLQYLRSAYGGLGRFASISSEHAAATVPLTWIRSVSITSAIGRLLESMGRDPSSAFLAAFVVAMLCLAAVWFLYEKHGFSLIGSGFPSSVMAVEWAGLTVAWLLFGPEVSRRHMYVLLLLHVVAATLLFTVSRGRLRNIVLAGVAVSQLGLRLPPSGASFAGMTFAWNWIAGPSWSLLIYFMSLLSVTLAEARNRLPVAEAAPVPVFDDEAPEPWPAIG